MVNMRKPLRERLIGERAALQLSLFLRCTDQRETIARLEEVNREIARIEGHLA